MNATTRRTFLVASSSVLAGASLVLPASGAVPASGFDRAAFEARARAPYLHRQAFAAGDVADGAVLGFMANSLDAYERGFGEGPGTLHAAAVLYHNGVAIALNDDAWRTFGIADLVRQAGDRTSATAADGNLYLRAPRGRTIGDLQQRGASFFVCANALGDLARRASTSLDALSAQLVPGAIIVPAGVAAINALQEEHFTLFIAAV
jgi:intracellular sulfur oxidation DsrE/DsrF family protein